MKDLSRIKGKHYIDRLVADGEHLHQDFKFMISDARKIARSLSAFANCEGGHLLIGVKDNGTIAGVRNEEDIYVVEEAALRHCNPPQQIEFTAYNTGNGITVIRAAVARSASRPVLCRDTDSRWRAYIRVADENIAAHPLMVKAWRMESSPRPLFTLSETESALLDMLDSAPDGISPRDIALNLHIPIRTADDMVVRLASLGIIGFRYIGQGTFSIVRQR